METAFVSLWKRLQNTTRPAEPPVNPYTNQIPGRIGNGGVNAGHIFSGHRVLETRTVSLFPLVTMYLWLIGQAIMHVRKLDVRLFLEAYLTPKKGF